MSQHSPRRLPSTQERAASLRKNTVPAEQLLWSLLRDRRLAGLKFRRQHPIGPSSADFYCHKVKLIVEVDGETHESRLKHDAERMDYLHQRGMHVYRVSNEEVWSNLEGVGVAILRFLEMDPQPWLDGRYRKPPHPNPLPRDGGEGTGG